MKKILVVGAGAAGMLAAGQAARNGADVILLEKMERPGKKISISGKGRCNLTNIADVDEFLRHFNRDGRFLRQCFAQFFAPQLMQFFEQEGLPLVIERGGRVFPASGKAGDVLSTLLHWLKKAEVEIRCNSAVTGLVLEKNRITGVISRKEKLFSDAVILATGGASYPATGSSGDGYLLAQSAGHSLVPLKPALVPLVTSDRILHGMAGLDLRLIGVRIFVDGKRKINDFGEVGFTHTGIGGPIILTHSRFAVENLEAGHAVVIALDLKPALSDTKLDARLQRDLHSRHGEIFASVLRGLLPEQIIPVCLHYTMIDGKKCAGEITAKERRKLRTWIKDFRFPIQGYRPLREAIVTAGGIPVKQVNPLTMESLITKKLYLTGELLDIDADTGGYNLQAAFSTGWLAGRSAALS